MARIYIQKPDPISFLVKRKYPRYFREDSVIGNELSKVEREELAVQDNKAREYLEELQKLPQEEKNRALKCKDDYFKRLEKGTYYEK